MEPTLILYYLKMWIVQLVTTLYSYSVVIVINTLPIVMITLMMLLLFVVSNNNYIINSYHTIVQIKRWMDTLLYH